MRPKIRNILIEPKKFFGELSQVISWKKVIMFLLVVVFFVQIGIFIYNKNNPIEPDLYAIDKVQSPFTNHDDKFENPSGVFGVPSPQNKGNALATNFDVSGIFDEKTKNGNNLPPVARAKIVTTSQTEGIYAGDTVFLSAADSYDPDGRIVEYRWDFDQSNGIGIDADGVNATVKYANAGVYTITLVAIDENGGEGTTTLTITVNKKPEERPNGIIQGLTSNKIDFDSLNFTSRIEIQNALEQSFAEFQSQSYSLLAQAIYNSQRQTLPALPSLSDIELAVGKDLSNLPPVIDSVLPSDGAELYSKKPIISAGFYGNNEIDIDSIELLVDGKAVTNSTLKNKFGVQYTPNEELEYGEHHVMLVIADKQGLKSTKSWKFTIVDPTAENDELVPKYEDKQGPQIILHYPDENAKNVKPDSTIRVSYDEKVVKESVEVAVVDLSTNVTKFFTGNQLKWNSTGTGFEIEANENIFEYERAYQIVVRQEDELGNKSKFEWYVLGEQYNAPEFTITYPENNSTVNQPQITVTGFADPSYMINVGGTVAMVDANGAFKADISLTQGKNEILITAKDLKGKESSQYLIVTYDPSANGGNPVIAPKESPVIMDASIKDKEVTDKIRPQISFVFADTDGIDTNSVVLKVDDVDVTNYAFVSKDSITYKPLEPLAQGEHTVELIVADKKGNTTNYTMTFMVDAYPDQPTNLVSSLTNNNTNVLLVWDAVTNITNAEYRVYRSTSPNVETTPANEVKRGLTTTSWIDTNVIDGTTYYYVVAAVTQSGNLSHASNETSITVDATAPVLKVIEPQKNTKTEEKNIIERGQTEKGAIIEVYLNFQLVGTPTVNDNGEFEQALTLIPGENIITTVATDEVGNETVDVRTVTYQVPDTDAPRAISRKPTGTNVPVNTKIEVTYDEPINPNTFKMYLKEKDSDAIVAPITINDIALQVSNDDKTFIYTIPYELKYQTEYEVTIEAYDKATIPNESVNDDWTFRTVNKSNPVLEIITPVNNFEVDRTLIDVTGTTEPHIDVHIRVSTSGGEAPREYNLNSNGDGSFIQTVELYPNRANTITVTATDGYGRSSIKVINGVCTPPDKEKPFLSVTSPVNNTVTKNSTIAVTGMNESNVRLIITVNGEAQHDFQNNSTTFSRVVNLSKGQNIIRVEAIDAAGNNSVAIVTVFRDDNPPLLQVANPVDGLTTNQSQIELRGITEREGITLTVRKNGGAATNVSVLPDGSFAHWITLSVGNNYLVITATNNLGNSTQIVRSVYYDPTGGVFGAAVEGQDVDGNNSNHSTDNNPSVEGNSNNNNQNQNVSGQGTTDVIDPATGLPYYRGSDNTPPSNITFTPSNGTVTNNPNGNLTGYTEQEALVAIYQNGIYIYSGQADVNNGRFSTPITLQEGKNIFITTAQDASGNMVVRPNIITLDTKGPSLSVLSPMPNKIFNTNEIVVYGVTEPNTSLTITLDSNTRTITSDEQGYFNTKIQTGSNGNKNLTVVARDASNNQTTKTVPVTIDKTEPSLNLSSLNSKSLSGFVTSTPYGSGVITIDTVQATISGNTEINTTIEVRSNDRLVATTTTSSSSGSFTVNVTGESGATSNISVTAIDTAGNKTTRYFRMKVDKLPPTVEIYIPEGSQNLNSSSVTLTLIVTDDSYPVNLSFSRNNDRNVTTRTVNSSSPTSVTISNLETGSNLIEVKAVDSAGNQSITSVGVVYEPSADDQFDFQKGIQTGPDSYYSDLAGAIGNASSQIVNNNYGPWGQFNWNNRPPTPQGQYPDDLFGLLTENEFGMGLKQLFDFIFSTVVLGDYYKDAITDEIPENAPYLPVSITFSETITTNNPTQAAKEYYELLDSDIEKLVTYTSPPTTGLNKILCTINSSPTDETKPDTNFVGRGYLSGKYLGQPQGNHEVRFIPTQRPLMVKRFSSVYDGNTGIYTVTYKGYVKGTCRVWDDDI